jgi:hypothetical protein
MTKKITSNTGASWNCQVMPARGGQPASNTLTCSPVRVMIALTTGLMILMKKSKKKNLSS